MSKKEILGRGIVYTVGIVLILVLFFRLEGDWYFAGTGIALIACIPIRTIKRFFRKGG